MQYQQILETAKVLDLNLEPHRRILKTVEALLKTKHPLVIRDSVNDVTLSLEEPYKAEFIAVLRDIARETQAKMNDIGQNACDKLASL